MNAQFHTWWAMSHIGMSHITRVNEPYHIYEYAMSHMNEPCRTYECAMSHIWKCNVTHDEPCRTSECTMCVTHGNVPCRNKAPLQKHRTNATFYKRKTCNGRIESVMSHIWMSHVAYMSESCCTYEWVMLHIWMSHVPHMNQSCCTYEWVMSHIWMSRVAHVNKSCRTYEWVMLHI